MALLKVDPSAPDYRIVPRFFSEGEVQELVQLAATFPFEFATIGYPSGAKAAPAVRNNARATFSDSVRAASLFARMRELGVVPEVLFGREVVGVSDRFRFYRYLPGQQFLPHRDGVEPGNGSSSLLTALMYLTSPEGGATHLVKDDVRVACTPGSLLLFQHAVLHAGFPVFAGEKLVLRTDVMYARSPV